MAFPKIFRLKNKRDIDAVFKKGTHISGDFFSLKYTNNNIGHARIIIIASRSRKTVVLKHKIIRRTSEVFNSKYFLLLPFDIVIIVTELILRKPYQEIKAAADRIIKKFNFIK